MYPLRYMRAALDTELPNHCADRRVQRLTSTTTRVTMWEPKAGGVPPERYSLSRPYTRRKESDHEESDHEKQSCGNRSSVRAGKWSSRDCSSGSGTADRDHRGHCERRSEGKHLGYTVRARDVATGMIAGNVPLTADALFTLPDLSSSRYLIELVRHQGNQDRVVCTEGPFDLTDADAQERRGHRLRQSAGGLVAARRSSGGGYHGRYRRGQRQPLAIAFAPRWFEVSPSARTSSTVESECIRIRP